MLSQQDIETRRIWITSDIHLGHANIVIYSIRPGFDAYMNHDYDRHNELIVQNHNMVVGKNDIVLNLGDIAFDHKGVYEYAPYLNGEHYYIRGNHDSDKTVKALAEIGWKEIEPFSLQLPEGRVAFSHYPIYQLPAKTVSVHGHVHNNPYNATYRHINVSVEVTGYTPILLARVIEQAIFALTKHKGNDADKNEPRVLQQIHDNQISITQWKDAGTGRKPPKK